MSLEQAVGKETQTYGTVSEFLIQVQSDYARGDEYYFLYESSILTGEDKPGFILINLKEKDQYEKEGIDVNLIRRINPYRVAFHVAKESFDPSMKPVLIESAWLSRSYKLKNCIEVILQLGDIGDEKVLKDEIEEILKKMGVTRDLWEAYNKLRGRVVNIYDDFELVNDCS